MIVIQLDFGSILGVYCLLFSFGMIYNSLIAWAQQKHYLEGYTSIAVAFGAGITIAMIAFVSWPSALLTAGAFIASGTPMIGGSVWRHISRREQAQRAIKDEATHEQQTERMA